MNKKFSTLVAAALLATSTGASAQKLLSSLTPAETKVESNQYYYLSNPSSPTSVLYADGDSLVMKTLTGLEVAIRNQGLWKVSYSKDASGAYVYSLENKATNLALKLPTSGKALANGGTLSSFSWIVNPTTTVTAAQFANGSAAAGVYALNEVYVLQGDLTVAGTETYATLTKGYKHLEVLNYNNGVAAGIPAATTISNLVFGGAGDAAVATATTAAEVSSAKAALLAMNTALKNAGVATTHTGLANYRIFEAAVNALKGTAESGTDLQDGTAAKNARVAAVAAITAVTGLVSDYGLKSVDATSKISGIVYLANASATVPAGTYAEGTKFVVGAPMTFAPARMGVVEFNTTAGNPIAAAIAGDKDAAKVNATFVAEFKKGSTEDKDVAVTFSFPAQTMESNILAGTEFQLVQRNLLIQTSGIGFNTNNAAATVGNYKAATLLKVKGEDKYLVVDTTTFEKDKADSKYYTLKLAELKDLTSSVSAPVTDTKYFNAKGGYHAAAYVFDVRYDVEKDSMVIKPAFILSKPDANKLWVADSLGSTDGASGVKLEASTGYQISSKEFSTVREMTVINSGDKVYKIATDGTSTPGTTWETTTLPTGAYLINLVSDLESRSDDNGKYKVAGILSKNGVESLKAAEAQKFVNMPAAQWIVEQNASSKLVKIYNRETGATLNGFNNIQLYKAGAADQVSLFGGDTLKVTPITGNAVTDSTWGYFADKAETLKYKKFNLNYYNELNDTKLVDMAADSTMFVNAEEGSVYFSVLPAGIAELHKDVKVGTTTVVEGLKRTAYNLFLTGVNIKGDTTFVVKNTKGDGYRLMKTKSTAANVASFYVAEYNNKVAETKTVAAPKVFFAFVEKAGDFKMGVRDGGTLALTREGVAEVRTSAFALLDDAAPVYRRLGVTKADDGFTNGKTDTAKIYLARNDQRFLYENTKNNIAGDSTGVNYLGEYNSKQFTNAAAMFIDTAYVRNATNRPQYMLALRPQFGKWIPCPEDATHSDKYEYQVKADYLVNLTDSLYGQKNQDRLFKFEEKTRLAFVPAIHHGDSLIINNSRFTGNSKQIKKGEDTTFAAADTIDLAENAWNHVTFQFRLVDGGADADFYIESCNEEGIFSFVQILNGVPVLTNEIEDAERFNIGAPTKDAPTDNEGIETTEVSVIAGAGQVVINNAQGKTVAISNILGQTIANTVLTSDNATISVPAGIVVVAVEGESAVKVIVK